MTIGVGEDHTQDHQNDQDQEVGDGLHQGDDEILEILEILDQGIMTDEEVITIVAHLEDHVNLKKNNHLDHQIDHFLYGQ